MRVIPGAQHEESGKGGGTEAFIIGAGFSKAVSGHMPLVDEINIALRWAEDYGLAGLNFEEQLTFLAQNQPWLTEAQNLRNRAEFLDQSSSLAKALDASQRKVLADPIPGWFRDLVDDWIRHGPWIVSLNYDTLVEHAYTKILPAEEGRVLAHSAYYAIPIQGALSRTQLVPSPHRDQGVGRLIKLHGSLNWRYSGSDRAVGEEIYDIGLVPGWTDSPLNTAARAAAVDKVPLVIPPTLEKSPFFINETVRGLWRLAKSELEKSSHWYVIGYSLPDGDHNMLGLLRNAIQGSPKLITVVNRDEAVAERYRHALRGLENIRLDLRFVNAGAEAFASAHLTNGQSTGPNDRVRLRIRWNSVVSYADGGVNQGGGTTPSYIWGDMCYDTHQDGTWEQCQTTFNIGDFKVQDIRVFIYNSTDGRIQLNKINLNDGD